MSRKHNTKHHRMKSAYAKRKKAEQADKYGIYNAGVQSAPDKIAGHKLPVHIKMSADRTNNGTVRSHRP